ncbi:protein kinase [Streptomyces sp. NPDC000410]|uniref:WD40 repeat domain-containing serine/threonine protein kinase n=1 Tax=Streptomyces sp. NPDC000410 TaxID=3154254 RepID=UPI003316EAA1
MTVRNWRSGDVVLDLYEVLDVLSGGMGLVYRARHRGWNTDLAVKVPGPRQAATAAGRADFETEAGTWVGLGLHPNVVNCHYVRRVDGLPCVFAEWVAGGSLAELVRDGRLYEGQGGSPARVLDMAVQIAWGIDHAHRQGVIHQDVKPANIMVDIDADWTAKVTDFGLAGARAAAGEHAAGAPDASLQASFGGMTRQYRSPEQADAVAGARVTLTRATDVWSWALCVLEMFVGGRPWEHGQLAPEVFADFLESGRPRSGVPAMPPALVDLLRRCFDVDPAARPHRLDELAAAVTGIYADAVGSPYPRVPPKAADLLADGLSNQALSLLDLDRADESERLWRAAMDIDPHHPSTVYNWALYRWRRARLSDEQVVSDLCTARTIQGERWQADHLLGLVHVERGDHEAARELLAAAPESPEVELARAELARRGSPPRPERLSGHRGAVTAIAIDATGEVALTGGADGRVRVWAPAQNRCRYELPPSASSPVTAVAVTGDGRRGLTAHREGPVELWDLGDGTRLRVLTAHASGVLDVALTGSGAAVAYHSGLVQVWDPGTGRLVRELTHPPTPFRKTDPATRLLSPEIHHSPAPVSHVAISEDGGFVVSGAPSEGGVAVWDVARDRAVHQLVTSADMHRTGIDQLALSPDGTYALLAGGALDVHIWETRADRTRDTVPNRLNPHSTVVLNSDATVAVSIVNGGIDQPLQVWETRSGRCLRTIDARSGETAALGLRCVALSGDGRVVVLGDAGGGVQVHHLPRPGFRAGWSYARPRTAAALEEGEKKVRSGYERAQELTRRGMTAAAAGVLRAARAVPGFERHPRLRALWGELGRAAGRRTDLLGIWRRYDLKGGSFTFTPRVSLALSDDAELMVTGGADGRVRVWELQTGQGLHAFPEQVGNTHTILIAEESGIAVTADWAGTAHLWDFESGTRRAQLYGNRGRVKAVSMDRKGQYALVGDAEGALCLWRLRPAARVRTMPAHDGPVGSVRLSDDGTHAASAGRSDRTVMLWRTAGGRRLHSFPVGPGQVELRFGPDGRRLFVNTTRGLTAWDVPNCRQMYAIDTDYYPTLAMSADGRIGATCGVATVRVWEADTGRVIRELPENCETFDVSPDGRYVLTAGFDRILRLWSVRSGMCVHTLAPHPEIVTSVRFTSDGRNVVSTDARPAIRLWELDWDYRFTGEADAR